MGRDRFTGAIAGVGSTSGVRVVVGRWRDTPYGPFTTLMVAQADGTRVLLAPSAEVADFVAATYVFDRVERGATGVRDHGARWCVHGPGLELSLQVGRRSALGRLLRLVPARLATAPTWAVVTDPVARVLLPGVRTRGTAREGRREYYGATDLHHVVGLDGSWQGVPLGDLAPVHPEPGFGFGSTPRRPSVTAVVTTVDSG